MLPSLLLLALAGPAWPGSAPPTPQVTALTHVDVVDVVGGSVVTDRTVVVAEGRIQAVGAASAVKVPRGARTIDSRGRFVIPGLWDMHAHLTDPDMDLDTLPTLCIVNGVTGVRDMFSEMAVVARWRREMQEGRRVGPRLVAAGPAVDGPDSLYPGTLWVRDGPEGRAAVEAVRARGADFVKLLSFVPREAYFALAKEARARGVSFAGHVPYSVTAAEASDAGQASVEHLTGVLQGCSSREAELQREVLTGLPDVTFRRAIYARVAAQIDRLAESYSEERAEDLWRRFRKNGTWSCPTLTVLRWFASPDDASLATDPRLRFIVPALRAQWEVAPRLSDEERRQRGRQYRLFLETVGRMRRAGVGLLAGTDAQVPFIYPGFSLHDELALLVEAGVPPIDALRSATIGPARFLGREADLGSVEAGKQADLVVLTADPLADIHNTNKIEAVFAAGRYLSRLELQGMLDAVAVAASKPDRTSP